MWLHPDKKVWILVVGVAADGGQRVVRFGEFEL